MGRRETILTLLALAVAGISPLLIVFGSGGVLPMPLLFWGVLLPGQVVFWAILLYARARDVDRLYRRLWIGVVAGILLTMALDVVRSAGVHLGYFPDSISLFGRLITGRGMQASVTPLVYGLGLLYHFANGIAFGVVYSVLFGLTRWWGAVLYSVFFVELGMMTLPPMAKMMGPFGIGKYGTVWNGMFLDTLLAHVAMGIALGVVMQRWAPAPGLLFAAGRGAGPHPVATRTAA